MPGEQLSTVLRHIRTLIGVPPPAAPTDSQLLERFAFQHDEAAFEILMQRHGPMVLGVCRRWLADPWDAEDAFQATFLVLVRKAPAIGRRELLGHWLYGVAYRVAQKARARAARRRSYERQVEAMPPIESPRPAADSDLRQVLDEEVQRLPVRYRVPVVLCYLQGKTNEEAAQQMRCPEGTVKSRLAQARDLLRPRFARRGVALSSGALVSLFARNAASAAVPTGLLNSTTQAAFAIAAGNTAATGVVSTQVASLMEGVLQAMYLTKFKIAAVVLLALGIVGTGVGVLTLQALADKPAVAKPKEAAAERDKNQDKNADGPTVPGIIQAIDAGKNTITVTTYEKGKKEPMPMSLTLAAGVKVLLPREKKEEPKEGKLADLSEGLVVDLQLSADKKTVSAIQIHPLDLAAVVKMVDSTKNSITVITQHKKPAEEQTLALAAGVKVVLPTGKKEEPREGKLADLSEGVSIVMRLSLDRKTVLGVAVQIPTLGGTIKSVDAAKNTITVGQKQTEDKFVVAADAKIYLPTDKKEQPPEGKLSDLSEGLGVGLQFSLDRKMVVAINVQSPSIGGSVKSVDAAKRTITIGQKGSDQTFDLAKDASVYMIDGKNRKEGKLADLTEGMLVNLRLSLDKKTVLDITVQPSSVQGNLKGVDAGNHTITIAAKGDDDKTYVVDKEVRIILPEGAKDKEGKLADLPAGTGLTLQLSLDGKTVQAIVAYGFGINGTVKAVDLSSKTITLTVKQDGNLEDQTFDLVKGIDLTDVSAGVQLSGLLSLDKKTMLNIHVQKDKQK